MVNFSSFFSLLVALIGEESQHYELNYVVLPTDYLHRQFLYLQLNTVLAEFELQPFADPHCIPHLLN